ERRLQPLPPHGLQEVVHGAYIERVDRMLLVCRHEDHKRRSLRPKIAHGGQSSHLRHMQIEEYDIRLVAKNLVESFGAGGRFPENLDVGELLQRFAQNLACDRLVVDDQRLHRAASAARRTGTRKLTLAPLSAESTCNPASGP